ncbi:helix-turn-helix domain-containing protein [Streptomyces sp. HC44]|uniref:Helix-turn-helix domain-containing protein n=1 Tax=Streptomyces scabichelini TaxID=2711217 RepID=A0A6G4V111_9ACTN|nr:helix-turn-helix domain-containing protein [Streptomyces scabichelini]NGO07615.1 helix-turn-helix domain-containing protein [Streptomyces scabichelini]
MGRHETPLDPAAGPVQRFAYELRKLRQEAGGLTYREMARRAHYSVTTLSRAAAGDQLPSLAVTLAYVNACGGDPAEWERRWHEASEESVPDDEDDADSPYQGLSRFEPTDHDRFFGRDELVSALGDLASTSRFAAVFGPSGSGKSSLLRAGLIPELQQSGDLAALRILTPGEHPLRTHEKALKAKEDDGSEGGGIGDTVLVIDQFEEVFTLCREPAERTGFIDRLLTAREPASRLRVIIAVRADFYARCAEHRALADALSEASLLVGPMTPAELREAVIRPAQSAGLIVERELTAHLVEEVDGEPGGLPLLSHALRETWRRRRGRALTMAGYEAAGGVRGAIAQTAEDAYGTLSGEQAVLARQILLRLITPGEGSQDTRRPVDRAELDFAPSGEVALVLDRLARSRLLTLDDDTVDLAHEALITSWPRLSAWIEEARERLRTHRRLTEAARTWDELGRDPGALYRGTRLATADEHLADQPLTPLEEAFLTAARTSRSSELRRRRGLFTTLAALLVLALIAGITAWQQSRTSDRRHHEAEARRIAAVADSMRAADPVTAARLSVAAWELAPTVETRSALLSAQNRSEQDAFTVPERDDRTTVRRLTSDGRTLVSVSREHVRTWDLRTHRRTGTYPGPGKLLSEDGDLIISPDGRTLALGSAPGGDWSSTTPLWDVRTGRVTGRLPGGETTVSHFGRGGRTIVMSASDSSPQVWDTRTRRLLLKVPLRNENDDPVTQYAVISDDERLLATCSNETPLEIWDIARRRTLSLPWTAGLDRDLCKDEDGEFAFSPDGRAIALASGTGIQVRDIRSGRVIGRLTGKSLKSVRFSADAKFLVAAGPDGIRMWRLSSPGEPVFRHTLATEEFLSYELDFAAGQLRYLNGSASAVRSLGLGPATTSRWQQETAQGALLSQNGRTLVTVRSTGAAAGIRLKDTRGAKSAFTVPHKPCPAAEVEEGVCSDLMALSADGRTFAYLQSADMSDSVTQQSITVWDVTAHRKRATIAIRFGPEDFADVDGLALSADGRTLLVSRAAENTVEVWDVRRNERTRTLKNISAEVLAVRGDLRTLASSNDEVADLRSGRVAYRTLGDTGISTVTFSPDGRYFAAGDSDGRVTVWDGEIDSRLGILADTEATEFVSTLAFSPDGDTLAVADDSGTVRLWDVPSSRPLGSAVPGPGDRPLALAFAGNGTALYVAGSHVPLQTYDFDPDHVIRRLCARTGSGLSEPDWKTYLPDIPYRRTCEGS